MPVGSLHQLIVCKQCGLLSTVYTVTLAIYQKNLWDKEIGFQIKTSMIQLLPTVHKDMIQHSPSYPLRFCYALDKQGLDLVLAFIHCIIDTSSRPYYSFHPPHPFIPLSIFNANKYHSYTSHS